MDGSGEGCVGEEEDRGIDEMTLSFDRRDRRPGRDEDASAFSLSTDGEVVSGLGEEALAASHADRVVWSTGH